MEVTPKIYRVLVKVILTTLVLSFSSCILFKKKCPLPTCEIRKMHRHLLIFKDVESKRSKKKKAKKLAKQEKKLAKDSVKLAQQNNVSGSDSTSEGVHKATYYEVDGEVLDEEGNVFVDPKEQKRRDKLKAKEEKKKAKKAARKAKLEKKGELTEEELIGTDEEENEYAGMTEEEYKQRLLEESNNEAREDSTMHAVNEKSLAKQLKKEDRVAKRQNRKEERKARKNKKGESDFTKLYRSRVTKWWRRNQNPKTGKYWRRKRAKTRIG